METISMVKQDSTLIFSALTLANAADYTCVVTSSMADVAESDLIVLTVNPLLEVVLDIEASTTSICQGETITFTSNSTNEGNAPVYSWYVNGTGVGSNQDQLQLDNLNDGDQISCELQSSENCTTNNPATSAAITIEVNPLSEPEISIVASTTSICEGEEITFQATTANGGTNPEFSWYVNSILMPGNNDQLVLNMLQNGDEVSCELLSSYVCPQQNQVSSNGILIEVQEFQAAAVSIESAGNTICEGGDLMMEAIPVNGGNTPEFIWLINGTPTGANTPLLTVSNPNNGDEIIVKLISSGNCITEDTVNSAPLAIIVTEEVEVEVEVTIEAEVLTICQGEELTINAIAQNGGSDVTYPMVIERS